MSPSRSDGELIVVDASAFIRSTAGSEAAAEWFRAAWRGEVQLVAPELIVAEVTHQLVRYRRAGHIELAVVMRRLRQLERSVALVRLRGLSAGAVQVAGDHGLSGYDAFYAALASHLRARLLTADRRLVAAVERGVLIS